MQWISFATASVNITIAAMFFGGWVMTKHRMLLGYALSYAFYTVGFACFAIQHLNPLIVHFGNGALIVGTMVLAYALAQRSRWQLDGFSCLIISGLGVSAILLGVSLGSPQVGYVGVYGSLGLTTLMAARAGHGARPGDILEKTVVWTLYAVAAIMLSNPRFLNGFMPDMVPFEFAEGSWAFYATVWIIMSQLLAGSLIALAMRDVIQRAQKEAVIDPLSGLLNRRGFNAALNRDHRKGDRAALVMVDIDHFKAINDQLGHDVGDMAIELLGAITAKVAPDDACAARLGGEEFAVLLNTGGTRAAWSVARQIHFEVRNSLRPLDFTVSIGIGFGPHAKLYSRADTALYDAKNSGRNCTCAWQPEDEQNAKAPALTDSASPGNAAV